MHPGGEIFRDARAIIASGLADHAFPAATIDVGRATGPIWQEAFGHLTYAATAPACALDTVFDLASLTKVIATTSLMMQQIDRGRLSLETRVADLLPQWRGAERAEVCLRHLLDHSSGLPAHVNLWEHAKWRKAFEAAICRTPIEHPPGTASVYSDLDFILLGFMLEDALGRPLDEAFRPIEATIGGVLRYRPGAGLRSRIAPTEETPARGRVANGEVHDENAAALGGVAGHAGLFGTGPAVGGFARLVLETFQRPTVLSPPPLMARFATRTDVPASTRALGWDTMQRTSSCGTLMSPTAIGHTGFTGTSLWIDYERDLYVVFLTNRVHPTRENELLLGIRPKLHDAIMRAAAAT